MKTVWDDIIVTLILFSPLIMLIILGAFCPDEKSDKEYVNEMNSLGYTFKNEE